MIVALVAALVVIAVAVMLVQRRRRRRRVRFIPVAPPVAASEILVAEPVAMPDVAAVEAATLAGRLGNARGVFARLRGAEADAAVRDVVEEVLLRSDVGVTTTTRLLDELSTAGSGGSLVNALRERPRRPSSRTLAFRAASHWQAVRHPPRSYRHSDPE